LACNAGRGAVRNYYLVERPQSPGVVIYQPSPHYPVYATEVTPLQPGHSTSHSGGGYPAAALGPGVVKGSALGKQSDREHEQGGGATPSRPVHLQRKIVMHMAGPDRYEVVGSFVSSSVRTSVDSKTPSVCRLRSVDIGQLIESAPWDFGAACEPFILDSPCALALRKAWACYLPACVQFKPLFVL